MRVALAALALVASLGAAHAQLAPSKASLSAEIDARVFPNSSGNVTPQLVNSLLHDMLNAMCGLNSNLDCPLPSNTFIIGSLTPGDIPIASADGLHIQESGFTPLKKYIDSVAPGPFQDYTQGYSKGSPGLNTSAPGVQYTALSVTPAGSASWIISNVAALPTYSGTTAPTVNTDSSQGFAIGSKGVNTLNHDRYTAISVAPGAAVWSLEGALTVNYQANNWYLARGHETLSVGTAIGSTTTIELTPFFATENMTIGTIGSKINVAGSSNYRMAIYAASPTTNQPTGSPLAQTSDILDTSTGMSNGALTSNLSLNPGMYWEAIEVNDLTAAFVGPFTAIIGVQIGAALQANVTGGAGNNTASCQTTTTPAYGVFPDLTSATFTTQPNGGKCGLLTFKVVSVP